VPTAVELCRAATPVVLRRLPLTAALALAVLVLGALSGARGTPADWLAGYVPLFLGLAVVGGFAEWRLGTWRAVVGAVVAHVAGVGGATILVLATAGRGWDWTTGPATHTDLGMTTAVLGAAATASATLWRTWRLRVRALLLGYAALALLLVGGLAHLERLVGVMAGLATGIALAGVAQPVRTGHRADRRPVRAVALSPHEERDLIRQRLRVVGSTNRLAWMTTWPQNRWFHSGSVPGYLAHRVHAGVAIGLCDPVAVDDVHRDALLREFSARAQRGGLVPCVFAASVGTAAAAATMGWRVLPVGEEAVVELPGLAFHGRAWQDVRTAINQAARRGITVELTSFDELSVDQRRQVAEISHGWASGRRLPELGFTLGGLAEAADPEVRVAVAMDADGLVHGVTSWLPSHRPNDGAVTGWTLDVMRRREGADGFRPVMELLIAASLTRFRDEGCAWASLSASPLAAVSGADRSDAARRTVATDLILRQVAARLEPLYGFRSLHAFKAKFSPRFEPLFLVYPNDLALLRISVALARAYLPDVRLRDLAALRPGRPRRGAADRAGAPRQHALARQVDAAPRALSTAGPNT
jgi:lysylphosphatidylglycerol synthetase-like protein (DUF2156 family)